MLFIVGQQGGNTSRPSECITCFVVHCTECFGLFHVYDLVEQKSALKIQYDKEQEEGGGSTIIMKAMGQAFVIAKLTQYGPLASSLNVFPHHLLLMLYRLGHLFVCKGTLLQSCNDQNSILSHF